MKPSFGSAIAYGLTLATLFSFGASARAAGGGSTGALDTGAIAKLVAAEDNGFADYKGSKVNEDPTYGYYTTTSSVPGTSCFLMQAKSGGDVAVGCAVEPSTQSEADASFKNMRAAISAAAPSLTWKDVNSTSGKYIAQWLASDAGHAVLLYERQVSEGKYRVMMSFAKPSFFSQ